MEDDLAEGVDDALGVGLGEERVAGVQHGVGGFLDGVLTAQTQRPARHL